MQIVSSTLIAILVIILIAIRGPYRGLIILFAVTPMGAMAAFNLPAVGNTSITVIDIAVLVLFGMVLLGRDAHPAGLVRAFLPGTPGVFLLLFLLYAIVGTLYFPKIFAGQSEVFNLGRSLNERGIVLVPLGPSNGNLSQMYRLMTELMAFAVAAALIRSRPDPEFALKLMVVATVVNAVLGVLDVLTYAVGLEALMEPFRTANYAMAIGHRMAGLKRMVGGFPEASAFGYYSVGLLGFWLSYWFSARGRSARDAFMLALSLFVVLRSTSSSTYVAALALCAIFLLVKLTTGGQREISRRSSVILVGFLALLPLVCFSLYMAYDLSSGFQSFIDRSLFDKLSTDSGVERTSWNSQAIRNLLDTRLLGVGMGSMRASGWLFASLGSMGIIGTVLLLAFLWRLFGLAAAAPGAGAEDQARGRLVTAYKYGCLALLLCALLTVPTTNLTAIFYAMAGVAFGLSPARIRAGRPAAGRPAAGRPAAAPNRREFSSLLQHDQ